jgi:hypothetical protein
VSYHNATSGLFANTPTAGIYVTAVKQPDGPGAVVALRCPVCRVTEFFWSPYASRPADGFWCIEGCLNKIHWPEAKFPFEGSVKL